MNRIFLDANVLFKKVLLASFLDMAAKGLVTFLWSDEVLAEFSKNRKLKGSKPDSIDAICKDIDHHFGNGKVTITDYKNIVAQLKLTHFKDRHILAAASAAGAEYLLTFNLSDFDSAEAKALAVTIIHPDDFLVNLLSTNEDELISCIKFTRARRQTPPTTENELLEFFNKADLNNFPIALSQHIGKF